MVPQNRVRKAVVVLALLGASVAGAALPTLAANCRSNVECIPPVTTIAVSGVAGENGWWRSDVSALLVCTDDSGCSSSKFSLDQADWLLWDGAAIPVAGDGLHSLEAASEDQHGNKEIYPALNMVPIDTVAPSVALVRPTAGNAYVRNAQDPLDPALPVTVATGDLSLEASVSDATSGAQRVQFYVDGVLRATDAAAPFTWTWAAGDEALGDHSLAVVGFDVAGNSASASLTVTTVPDSLAGLQATQQHPPLPPLPALPPLPPTPGLPPGPSLPPLPPLPPLPGV